MAKRAYMSNELQHIVADIRRALSIDAKRTLTMVIDRGIYGLEAFGRIMDTPNLKIITWEKDYQLGLCSPAQRFVIQRNRNRANDIKVFAEALLRLMFCRWLQENDFKYMEKHYGINPIISYAFISYEALQDELTDRQIKSDEYKAIEKQRTELRKKT